MALDIVVVNYRTPLDLQRFLNSLEVAPKVECHLIVVDVEAEVDDERPISWGDGQEGLWIATTDNIGYARACNMAAARGSSEIIALFNADVELTNGALDACHEALLDNPSWGVLGPRQVDRHRKLRHAGIFGTNEKPVHRGWNERDRNQHIDVRSAVTVSGSAYFVRRSTWNELASCRLFQDIAPGAEGAFLPTMHYFEETFCSLHCRAHGYDVTYFGEVTIVHQWHQASPVGGWAEQQYAASQGYFRAACDHHSILHD